MSLFKIRQFWSTTSEDDEYFDHNSLLVAKINSDFDYVVTGSQSGVLRIFCPNCEVSENGTYAGFNPNDVIVEKILDHPILQVGSGRLVSGNSATQLAVLHPKELLVFSLILKPGKTQHGNQSYLQLVYEHKLRKSSANFVIGPFGESQNRDFVCVQSLDGILSFFEQESQISYVALPDFLLPGPLGYVIKTDSFVTVSSSWEIVSYRYKTLAEVAEESGDPIHLKQKISTEWAYNFGESVIDLQVISDVINKEVWIVVLGEKNLLCLSENGRLKCMKKLDYSPICMETYVIDTNLFTLVTAETNMLLVYENTMLKWSAHLDFLPTAIHRAFLKGIRGTLVLLSDEGRLECCYLGTEPSFFVAPPVSVPEIDFEKAEHELLALETVISKSNNNVDSEIVVCTFQHNIKNAASNYMCGLKITIVPQASFQEVQVTILVQRPLKVRTSIKCGVCSSLIYFSNLCETARVCSHAFLDEAQDVPSLIVEVKVSVINTFGVPRALTRFTLLPSSLILEAAGAEKENKHKITLTTDQPPRALASLFEEYCDSQASPNAIGFKGASGNRATILVAKHSEKYRLQSDTVTMLPVLIELLLARLKKNCGPDCKVSANTTNDWKSLNFAGFLQENLCQLTAQFRLIQKRLIAKYRAKNPISLKPLELLLGDTYTDISEITDKLECELENLAKAQSDLACALYLAKQLIDLLHVDKDLMSMISSLFCTNVKDLDIQAWEDVMDASFCYLLRTLLAKTEKDRLRAPHTSFDEVKDLAKFEKHLGQVLERLPKQHALKEDDDVFDKDGK
ncbi:hypothetical protein D910_04167 [Dendroctonus ponderosae]|uniref:PTHB1 N-terminal domain-containing protein n=1 Tax=Dendroctonus ponderosae TaxID=77166 RepID=U4U829_DENPD|nr:hypothetical protein D910_04167 [Dendroctonus ponderosae]